MLKKILNAIAAIILIWIAKRLGYSAQEFKRIVDNA